MNRNSVRSTKMVMHSSLDCLTLKMKALGPSKLRHNNNDAAITSQKTDQQNLCEQLKFLYLQFCGKFDDSLMLYKSKIVRWVNGKDMKGRRCNLIEILSRFLCQEKVKRENRQSQYPVHQTRFKPIRLLGQVLMLVANFVIDP